MCEIGMIGIQDAFVTEDGGRTWKVFGTGFIEISVSPDAFARGLEAAKRQAEAEKRDRLFRKHMRSLRKKSRQRNR